MTTYRDNEKDFLDFVCKNVFYSNLIYNCKFFSHLQ